MFGYIIINKQELKPTEYERYQAYYCGLCRTLKERYGRRGQLTLSYDMTFLMILLNGLYEPEERQETHACIMHPLKLHRMCLDEISTYAADMGVLLTYYNLLDNWKDDRDVASLFRSKGLRKFCRDIEKHYKRQSKAIEEYVRNLTECENNKDDNLDRAAGLTGEMLAEIFAYKNDIWEVDLRKVGFYLGKFIYLMDAYEDIERDIKSNGYNPWKQYYMTKTAAEFEEFVEGTLTLMMADCSKTFEKLPIVKNAQILRNILFAGVWSKYEAVKARRQKTKQ